MRTISPTARVLAACLALGVVGAGCGGGSDDKKGEAAKSSKPSPPPPALVGEWTVKLAKADVPPKAPPELENLDWTMRVTEDGGVGNVPTLTILNEVGDPLESSTLSVKGNTLTLSGEECAKPSGAGYTLVKSIYVWKVEGDSLSLKVVSDGCPDPVADTILASGPWKRS